MAGKDFVQITDHGLRINLKKLTPEIQDALLAETKEQSKFLTNYIIERHLTGGTSEDRLGVRSGTFRRMTLPIIPNVYSQKMKGGTAFHSPFARVQVGPKGQVTTIKPITAKYLAIPIGEALSASGAPRYSGPRAVPGLVPITSKKGNHLLVRMSKAGMEPLFLLLKETQVPARVWPHQILGKNIKKIASAYRERLKRTLKETL